MSPRIAWFNFLQSLKFLVKAGIFVGVLFAVGYGIREAIEHTFHENPDFRLQVVKLNENDIFDESLLVDYLEIDLTANIFDLDPKSMQEKILQKPAILSAKVERELPGTLAFSIRTRDPVAWITHPNKNTNPSRKIGGLLIDSSGFTFPCSASQFNNAKQLPVIEISHSKEFSLKVAQLVEHAELKHCMHLLKAFRSTYPSDLAMIDKISQGAEWSLNLTTRSGTVATFGLGDHDRQLKYMGHALRHAEKKGYTIETINLIPKRNVPITVREDSLPPKAVPVLEPQATDKPRSRQADDLQSLLKRN